jgi:hypothetical protein
MCLSHTSSQLRVSCRVSVDQFLRNEQMETQNISQAMQFFLQHSYKDVFRRKFHFLLAFCSVFLVVVSTLVINQIISKGSIIFLKIAEGNHGEIDAIITPSADIVAESLDGIKYDMPALMNYTAVQQYYEENDPHRLERLLLSPRKVFTGSKVLRESRSGLYNETSLLQAEKWRSTFTKKNNLPMRSDTYHVAFDKNLDDNTLVVFKTQREQEIQLGREYGYDPMGIGECKVVKDDESAAGGAKEGQIIFMRQGPFNLMPFVDQYEKENL